ncbi:ATP-binding cassette domain-containing protein [Alsobacter sp. SYSU M60028]|uniref:ATP-binding cassette domain-containing protein n=1 Tax=Alsobacter ponti TaxID=2962936 RepID=A0ABT1L6D6_9HYPH|nr:oligopeptide/dipeptide ABC transporter ATP-binding protein [Alsobacter ponti]MCP8936959.1 ATP-binding cassette domain-containing protein [Alsobacter ponti]
MTPLLEVQGLTKHYAGPHGRTLRALQDVSFTLAEGEVLGVVGESGCGKSTLGRAVLRLTEPTSGSIRFAGEELTGLSRHAMTKRRRDMQMVFQDPFGSLNPRHRVSTIVGEPLVVHGVAGVKARVAELLDMVGLPPDSGSRFPHEFSGGQRQRIAIARALALSPKLLVADEPVSALDVSIQSQIINLIAELRRKLSLSMIFISHDLSVIRHVSDRIAVMYLGRIVETGDAADIFARPAHPYTQALLSAVPTAPGQPKRERIVLEGDLPDPSAPPPGCAFHGRCRHAMPRCAVDIPALVPRRVGDDVALAACHLYEPVS